MTEAGIENHRGSNLFVAMGEDLGAGRWSIRAQVRPMVTFLWIGALVMALGGVIAASDGRYRQAARAASQEMPAPAADAPAPAARESTA